MSVVVIGDIGVLEGMIHIGDEAMFAQLVAELRERGLREVIGMSANPEDSARRYGIRAIARIGFEGTREQMAERMQRVLEGALPADDPAHAVADAVRSSTGVVIAGGGNLASTWPLHVYERATLAALARAAGVPLVVTGQTLGPHLDGADADHVAALLEGAALVGMREPASVELAVGLGLSRDRVHRAPDDASFVAGSHAPYGRPYCLVTLAHHVGEHPRSAVVDALAALLDRVVETTGLDILFSPHFGSLEGEARGDSVMHAAVAEKMLATTRELPAEDAATSAALAHAAHLVVSSRYHPAVFAVSRGVPTIGVSVDDYTRVKLTGALGTFGQTSVLDADRLLEGGGAEMLAHVWHLRDDIRERGLAAAGAQHEIARAWFDAIARVVGGEN